MRVLNGCAGLLTVWIDRYREGRMNTPNPNIDADLADEYRHFLAGRRSVQLATVGTEQAPLASYAPCVIDPERRVYIMLSELSAHTQNILQHSSVSALFIEDESEAKNMFARHRVTFACDAAEINRGCDTWERIIADFRTQFGDIVDTLCSLSDFHLFQLTPRSGVFVKGFGKAYTLHGDGLDKLSHITVTPPPAASG